jgi:hypothetical protein
MQNASSTANNQRHLSIPIEYLVAEIVAFPLASVAAFENNLTALDCDLKHPTGEVWRETEKHITHSGPDLSIDMALMIRDQFWFSSGAGDPRSGNSGLHHYLKKLSKEFLELRGDVAVPRAPASSQDYHHEREVSYPNRSNRTLRWLSYSLPVDLLLGATAGDTCPPSKVEYASWQMYRNLKDHGLVEPHLHLGGAMEFSAYWVAVLNRLAHPDLKDDGFKSPGAEMSEGCHLVPWLLRAAVARLLLARFLYTGQKGVKESCRVGKDKKDFFSWLHHTVYPEIVSRRGCAVFEILNHALTELRAGTFLPHHSRFHTGDDLKINAFLKSLYYEMINPQFPCDLDDHPESIHLCDPIAPLTRYMPDKSPNPEVCFVHRSMYYLEKRNAEDKLFAALFWQVVRMRCLLYRHVTQRPMTPGLMWFVRHFDRIGPGRKNVGPLLLVRTAARNSGLTKGLRSLEVRKSPKDAVDKMLALAQDGMDALRCWNINRRNGLQASESFSRFCGGKYSRHLQKSAANLEFGWIFHFEKLRGPGKQNGVEKPGWRHTFADPEQEISIKKNRLLKYRYQYRYADYYQPRRKKALLFGRLLLQFPRSLRVIRGIDVCTDELAVPGWVLAPIFRYLTEVSKYASQHLMERFGEKVPPLRKTVHVGEDFVHLLGGLRRVDEAVRFFKLGAGDRIGHGMALGTSPEAWAQRTGRVAMRLEDRLFDLVWEWGQYAAHVISGTSSRMAYVEREISRLSDIIFDKAYSPYAMERLVTNLYDEKKLKFVGFPEKVHFRSYYKERPKGGNRNKNQSHTDHHRPNTGDNETNPELELLKKYLTDPRIFEHGHTVEWIDVTPEIDTLRTLQNHLRQTIATLGLVVEVNPSSNLLIGNIADLKHHPFWRLDPPLKIDDIPPVAMCIGSDDPLTFATDLRREYALVYESLVDGGLSAKEAWEWVDRIRATGLNSRFTLGTEELDVSPLQTGTRYLNNYGEVGPLTPRSYFVLGLGERIDAMP